MLNMCQVYLQYGVQTVTRQINTAPLTSAYVTIILSLILLTTAFVFRALSRSPLFHRHVRRFFADYGMPISIVASSAVAYWGRFNASDPATLPVGGAFQAAGRREWLVRFWELDGKWVGVAFPFGVALWVLFFFDHNVSVRASLVTTRTRTSSHTQHSLSWPKGQASRCASLLGSTMISSYLA